MCDETGHWEVVGTRNSPCNRGGTLRNSAPNTAEFLPSVARLDPLNRRADGFRLTFDPLLPLLRTAVPTINAAPVISLRVTMTPDTTATATKDDAKSS